MTQPPDVGYQAAESIVYRESENEDSQPHIRIEMPQNRPPITNFHIDATRVTDVRLIDYLNSACPITCQVGNWGEIISNSHKVYVKMLGDVYPNEIQNQEELERIATSHPPIFVKDNIGISNITPDEMDNMMEISMQAKEGVFLFSNSKAQYVYNAQDGSSLYSSRSTTIIEFWPTPLPQWGD